VVADVRDPDTMAAAVDSAAAGGIISICVKVLARMPLATIGVVEDVVGAVMYLVSPAARLVTGHVLAIDGGWTAW